MGGDDRLIDETPTRQTVLKKASPDEDALPSPMPKLGLWLPMLLLVTYAVVLLARFFTRGDLYLAYFEDDYFYYLVVAKNIVLHGVSSFDGIRPTNGYQPLWQLLNTALYWIVGDHRAFFVALLVLVFLFVLGTYRTLRRTQTVLGTANGYGLACALLSITFMAAISRTGMEVSLTLFLLALFWQRMAASPLEEQTPTAAILSGLLASGVVLGRLDALIVVALYLLLTVSRPCKKRSTALRSVFYFSIGLLPVALYFAWNHATFGTWLPISGVAKNLKSPWHPSASTLRSLIRVRSVNLLLTWPACVLGLLFSLHRTKTAVETEQSSLTGRRVQLCVLLHPVLFYTVLSFTSDWPIWSWYLYPLVPVAALLGPETLSRWKPLRPRIVVERLTVAAACICLITLAAMLAYNRTERQLYEQAEELQQFSKSHPGRYAMGGGAGVPGYVMTSTLVQVEGLMGDSAFLDRIKRREPLVQALQELQVDYYATMLLGGPQPGPCYNLREPEMAGPRSPVMAGQLCAPVADIANPAGGRMLVFDIRRATAVHKTVEADEERLP
jgi:hypothetical protein